MSTHPSPTPRARSARQEPDVVTAGRRSSPWWTAAASGRRQRWPPVGRLRAGALGPDLDSTSKIVGAEAVRLLRLRQRRWWSSGLADDVDHQLAAEPSR